MRFVIFTHSLVSDWNHGNAHFLRGIASDLIDRGHQVTIFEPQDGWSRQNLIAEQGSAAVEDFERTFPRLRSTLYGPDLDLDRALEGAEAVLVHEWNPHELVRRIGEHHAANPGYKLFFHDTHHRAVTDPAAMSAYSLANYDGVLAYGRVLHNLYVSQGWTRAAWTWHEAADVRKFYPRPRPSSQRDLVWIGNWGDDERAEELRTFLIGPVKELRLQATVYGVRYPDSALRELADAGIEYRGWLPNYLAPHVLARHKVTIHVPRRPYADALKGIPTIRPFEALACGIPLVSAPWSDCEHLFRPGADFLFVKDGRAMKETLESVLHDRHLAASLSSHGLETIRKRHTCTHRVDELLSICGSIRRQDAFSEVA